MNIKNTISYNKTLSILAICFCLVLAFVLLCPSMQVFADYNELNDNAIVNFNQLSKFYNYSFSSTSGDIYDNLTIGDNLPSTLNNSHKYYYRFTINDGVNFNTIEGYKSGYNRILNSNANNGNGDEIFTGASDIMSQLRVYKLASGYVSVNFTLILIDLTLMFGENNDNLTIEQCEYLFSANYYNYTTGTQMPLSKSYLQGYQDGANDVWESLTTTFNNDILGTITYPSTIEGFDSNVAYDSQNGYYLVEGLAMLDLGSPITSQVNYKGEYFIPNYTGGGYIVFFKYEGNVLTPLIVSEIAWNNTSNFVDITFNINNVQQLYFGFYNSPTIFNNDTSFTMYCWTSELEIKTIDVALLIQSAYARGMYESNKEYSEGGTKYETIYNLGKAEGIAEQNGYATGLDVVATTFTQVFSIFNIEILPGIPLTIFILLPLLVGLIMFIVKMTKGE